LLAACTSKPAAPAVSGEPPSGKWSGDYGPSPDRRDQITVDLKWDNSNLGGVVHAGTRALPITKASFTPDSGAITMEFDAEGNGGQIVHYIVDGKVAGNTMSGTWTRGEQRGDFRVTKE
jgi:hypothetical protein